MRLSKPFLVVAAVAAVLVAIYVARRAISSGPISELTRLGNTELPTDSAYVRWYTQGAKCLGLTQPYDRALRYFTGHTVPASWNAQVSKNTLATTNIPLHLIFLDPYFAHDSNVVLHEQVHDALGYYGHPIKYFGAVVSKRCALTPGRG